MTHKHLILLLLPLAASAQEATDTTATSIELHEITVKAAPVVRKADRDLYIPSAQAREASADGLSLLGNLRIPMLTVNNVLESVSSPSGSVQLRINGRQASVAEVKAILPESVVRVEYHQDPGLRYGGAGAVVDFIVRNPTAGGSLMANAMYWMTEKPSGNLSVNAKINRGRSQVGLSVYNQLRKRTEIFREYREHFTLADGTVINRTEQPVSGLYNNNQLWASAYYNYVNPGKTNFYASLGLSHQVPNTAGYDGLLSTDGADPIFLSVESRNPFTVPSLNLYLDQKIGRDQTIVVDFVSTYTDSRSASSYIERPSHDAPASTDISTSIHDHNQYYGLEADYIKEWENSRLTAGISWNGYRNRSSYDSSDGAVFHQRRDRWYGFAEYFRRFGDFTATAGIGAEYNDLTLRESARTSRTWNVIPRVSAVWRKNWSTLRLSARRWTISPSLSETNPTMQQVDNFQYSVGNPDLKPYSVWQANLNWAGTFNRIQPSVQLGYYATSSDAIAPSYRWDGDSRLIASYSNGNRKRQWWWRAGASINVIPGWLDVSGYVEMDRYYTSGPDYRHSATSWSGDATIAVSHWGFQLTAQYSRAETSLTGETRSRSESFNLIQLEYTWRGFQFGAGIMMPFGKYNQETTLLNRNYGYTQIMRSNFIERMGFVTVSYTLQWGKQKRTAGKLIDASGESMTSKAASR